MNIRYIRREIQLLTSFREKNNYPDSETKEEKSQGFLT